MEGGLDFATKSGSSSAIRNGRVHGLDFEWDFGCRLGVGYKVPHDKWDLFLGYTYIHAHARNEVNTQEGAIFPSWQAPFSTTGTYVTQAKMQGSGNINVGDLELGRTCFAGKWLTIRPFIGVRGAVIDQHFEIQYKGGNAVAPGDTYENHLSNDFWGIGGRMGADTLWGLGRGFGVYANGAFALLSGHFDVKQVEKNHSHQTFVNLRGDEDPLVVTAEAALGVQWDYLFSKDKYHVGVKLGWEFNLFTDQNRLRRFVSSTNTGYRNNNDDLAFQGVTLGMRFDF